MLNIKKLSVLLIILFSAISFCRPRFKKVAIGPGSRIQRTHRKIVSFDHKYVPIKQHHKSTRKKRKHHRIIHHRPRKKQKRRFFSKPVFISSGYHLHDNTYNENVQHSRSVQNNAQETIYVTNVQGDTITIEPTEKRSLPFSVIFWIEGSNGRNKFKSTKPDVTYNANQTIVAN